MVKENNDKRLLEIVEEYLKNNPRSAEIKEEMDKGLKVTTTNYLIGKLLIQYYAGVVYVKYGGKDISYGFTTTGVWKVIERIINHLKMLRDRDSEKALRELIECGIEGKDMLGELRGKFGA